MITHLAGVTYQNEEYGVNRQDIIRRLSGKEKIYLKREPKNRFDKKAVAVFVKGKEDQKVGYIKAEIAGFLAEMWKDYKFFARISEIREGDPAVNKPWGISIEVKKREKEKKDNSKFKGKRMYNQKYINRRKE